MLPARHPVVSLTTDFGLSDPYVGVLKAVILGVCPNAAIVDITHLVPPQDVTSGAFALRQAVPFFPSHAIHLAIVDPGVGTARRLVAVASPKGTFVAPDNGVLAAVLPVGFAGVRAVVLDRPEVWLPTRSATFQGRDVLAPVAAYLAAGANLTDVGRPVAPESLAAAPWPEPIETCDAIVGQVLHVDHFGNLVTNVGHALVERFTDGSVWFRGVNLGPMVRTYGDREPGAVVACIGSSDLLEIAVVNGNAAATLGGSRGDPVSVTMAGRDT